MQSLQALNGTLRLSHLHKGTREGMTQPDLPLSPREYSTHHSHAHFFLHPSGPAAISDTHSRARQAMLLLPWLELLLTLDQYQKKKKLSLGIIQCIPVPPQSVFVQCFKYVKHYINANYYYNVPLLPVNSPHRPTDTFPTSRFSTFVASEITLFSFTLPFAIWSRPSEALNSLHYYEGLLGLVPNHSRNNPWWLVSDCVCERLCNNRALACLGPS